MSVYVVEKTIRDVTKSDRMGTGITAMRERAGEFDSKLAMQLTGIAMQRDARQMLDDRLSDYWDAREIGEYLDYDNEAQDNGTIIVGAGLHAAIIAAVLAARGMPKPVVLEQSDRPGGVFAVGNWFLNSGNRPGLVGRPGMDQALNYLPGSPVQPAMLSSRADQESADLGWIVRLMLALFANVVPETKVTLVGDDTSTPYVQVSSGNTDGGQYRCRRVIVTTGLGEPRRPATGRNVVTFGDLMQRMSGETFPLRGMRRVCVRGGGDSGKCTVEALLGIGPQAGLSVTGLDYVEQIDWYAPGLPATCERWRAQVRGRYQRIGSFLRTRRLNLISEAASTAVQSLDSVLVNGVTYDMVVDCLGYQPVSPLVSGRSLELLPDFRGIARKAGGTEVYVAGAAQARQFTEREVEEGISRFPENRAAIFRIAPLTAAFAASLD